MQEAFYLIQQRSNSILDLSYRWSVRRRISALTIEAYRINATLPVKTQLFGIYCFLHKIILHPWFSNFLVVRAHLCGVHCFGAPNNNVLS